MSNLIETFMGREYISYVLYFISTRITKINGIASTCHICQVTISNEPIPILNICFAGAGEHKYIISSIRLTESMLFDVIEMKYIAKRLNKLKN